MLNTVDSNSTQGINIHIKSREAHQILNSHFYFLRQILTKLNYMYDKNLAFAILYSRNLLQNC